MNFKLVVSILNQYNQQDHTKIQVTFLNILNNKENNGSFYT